MPREIPKYEDRFTFRYRERQEGGLVVWYSFDDLPEVGPIEVSEEQTAQLSDHVEGATRLLQAALKDMVLGPAPPASRSGPASPPPVTTRRLRLV